MLNQLVMYLENQKGTMYLCDLRRRGDWIGREGCIWLLLLLLGTWYVLFIHFHLSLQLASLSTSPLYIAHLPLPPTITTHPFHLSPAPISCTYPTHLPFHLQLAFPSPRSVHPTDKSPSDAYVYPTEQQ